MIKEVVQEYEKQLNISDVMVRNFEQDWRIGKDNTLWLVKVQTMKML
jgi:hypothetical protein